MKKIIHFMHSEYLFFQKAAVITMYILMINLIKQLYLTLNNFKFNRYDFIN